MAGFGRESSSSTLYGGTTTFLINLPVKAGAVWSGVGMLASPLAGAIAILCDLSFGMRESIVSRG